MSFCKPCRRCCGQPPQVQQQTDTAIHFEKLQTKTSFPYGFIEFHAGASSEDNNHSSPVLVVHLYRQAQHKANKFQDKRTLIVDNTDATETHQGPQTLKQEATATAELELIIIPVEDVIHISVKADITKSLQADLKTQTIPVYGLSENCCDRCCDGICGCCKSCCDCCKKLWCCCHKPVKIAAEVNTTIVSVNAPNQDTTFEEERIPAPKEEETCCTRCTNRFRCWCCRIKRVVEYIRRTHTKAEKEAARVIMMTIEYSRYSHPDTVSNARVLSAQDQHKFYHDIFKPHETLNFYLVNDTDFDPNNFAKKMQHATDLCRTVIQMKGVKDKYPSSDKLFNILEKSEKRTIGDAYREPELTLPTKPLARDQSQLAIQMQTTTTSQRPAIEQ